MLTTPQIMLLICFFFFFLVVLPYISRVRKKTQDYLDKSYYEYKRKMEEEGQE